MYLMRNATKAIIKISMVSKDYVNATTLERTKALSVKKQLPYWKYIYAQRNPEDSMELIR